MLRKPMIAAAALVTIAAETAGPLSLNGPAMVAIPRTTRLTGGVQSFRHVGEFRQANRIVDAALEPLQAGTLEIMKYHFSETEHAWCVKGGACLATFTQARADMPQTNVTTPMPRPAPCAFPIGRP